MLAGTRPRRSAIWRIAWARAARVRAQILHVVVMPRRPLSRRSIVAGSRSGASVSTSLTRHPARDVPALQS
eukprot:1954493-Lingulodinium_polyedra.AAC.1